MKQAIGKFVKRETNIVKTIGQPGEDLGQFAASRGLMRCEELIVAAAYLFVKPDVGRTAKTSALGVLVKNAADEERIISHVSTKQERLLGCGTGQRDQHIGNIFAGATPKAFASPDHLGVIDLVRALQLIRARKSFEQRANVIAKLAIADAGLLQNMSAHDV